MKQNKLDKLFKEKIEQFKDLQENIEWNPEKGWFDYQKKYLIKNGKLRKLLIYSCSAAAVFAVVFFSILYYQNQTDKKIIVNNNTNIVKEITLPCGNTVWLNKNSFVEYPARISQENNEIIIGGEVYLEFKKFKKQKYIVQAYGAVINVETKTSINIRAYENEESIDITVASGAVKISEESYNTGLSLLITEGNYCSVHKSQKLVYTKVNKNNNYKAWKTGKLEFNNQPIETVKDVLAEYYNTEIELSDKSLAYCMFSGTFELQPIDIILNQIKKDLNFVIKNNGNKITFSGKGCL